MLDYISGAVRISLVTLVLCGVCLSIGRYCSRAIDHAVPGKRQQRNDWGQFNYRLTAYRAAVERPEMVPRPALSNPRS